MNHRLEGISTLYFVWNADWSLAGAVRAASDFVRGVESCALCEIVYDGVREKREWKACKSSIPVPIETMCRNKLPEPHSRAAGNEFPVVLAMIDGECVNLLGKSEIESCRGDVDKFKGLLLSKLGGDATGNNG